MYTFTFAHFVRVLLYSSMFYLFSVSLLFCSLKFYILKSNIYISNNIERGSRLLYSLREKMCQWEYICLIQSS